MRALSGFKFTSSGSAASPAVLPRVSGLYSGTGYQAGHTSTAMISFVQFRIMQSAFSGYGI